MRVTNMTRQLRKLTNVDRLDKMKLPTLKYTRLRGDILEVNNIITGASNMDVSVSLHCYTTGRPIS